MTDKATILASRNNSLVKRYEAKAAGGKYVNIIKEKLSNITDEDFLILVEAVKTVPFGTAKDEAYEAKVKAWAEDKDYKESAPTKKLLSNKSMVPTILARYGWKDTDKSSWSAFVQHFEERIRPLVCNLQFVRTVVQSANYSRGAFMCMTFEEAYAYARTRTLFCVTVMKKIHEILGADLAGILKSGAERTVRAKNLTAVIFAKKGLLPPKEELDRVSADMILSEAGNDIATAIVGALPVEFRMVMQCKEARGVKKDGKTMSLTVEDRTKIARLAAQVHNEVAAIMGEKVINAGDKVDLADPANVVRKMIFDSYKVLKLVIRSTRRAVNSDSVDSGSSAKRDYSQWSLTF